MRRNPRRTWASVDCDISLHLSVELSDPPQDWPLSSFSELHGAKCSVRSKKLAKWCVSFSKRITFHLSSVLLPVQLWATEQSSPCSWSPMRWSFLNPWWWGYSRILNVWYFVVSLDPYPEVVVGWWKAFFWNYRLKTSMLRNHMLGTSLITTTSLHIHNSVLLR